MAIHSEMIIHNVPINNTIMNNESSNENQSGCDSVDCSIRVY